MEQEKVNTTPAKDENKVFKILSYIWILWLVGLFCKEKKDKSVRFHVGQGIILTIVVTILTIAVSWINDGIIANIFRETVTVFGTTMTVVSGFGAALMSILDIAVWVFNIICMVIGIKNAATGKDEELPVIGKFAFYK